MLSYENMYICNTDVLVKGKHLVCKQDTHSATTVVTGLTTVYCRTPSLHLSNSTLHTHTHICRQYTLHTIINTSEMIKLNHDTIKNKHFGAFR